MSRKRLRIARLDDLDSSHTTEVVSWTAMCGTRTVHSINLNTVSALKSSPMYLSMAYKIRLISVTTAFVVVFCSNADYNVAPEGAVITFTATMFVWLWYILASRSTRSHRPPKIVYTKILSFSTWLWKYTNALYTSWTWFTLPCEPTNRHTAIITCQVIGLSTRHPFFLLCANAFSAAHAELASCNATQANTEWGVSRRWCMWEVYSARTSWKQRRLFNMAQPCTRPYSISCALQWLVRSSLKALLIITRSCALTYSPRWPSSFTFIAQHAKNLLLSTGVNGVNWRT